MDDTKSVVFVWWICAELLQAGECKMPNTIISNLTIDVTWDDIDK